MTLKSTFISFLIVSFLVVSALTIYWYVGHRPIAYHNACLRTAIESATRVEITTIGYENFPDQPIQLQAPVVTISDKSEIRRLLDCFKLPWNLRNSKIFHKCHGHIRITIYMPNPPNYMIQYDHGEGIYPIHMEHGSTGFVFLPKDTCTYLNDNLVTRGFKANDLGLHP